MNSPDDSQTVRERAFQRLWGIATIAHLAGNAHGPDIWPEPTPGGFVLLLCGLLASVCIVRPTRPVFTGLCVLVPLSAVAEVPFLGNHWLLASIVSLAWLACAGRWRPFENSARMVLVCFYAFAAFAKLNSGFLDPQTSCGLYYTNQMLAEYGLGQIEATSPLAWLSAWGAAAIELAVVPLLLWSKTRRYGLWLALSFHGFLTLDLGQHFYDFTSVLFALFMLFAPDETMRELESRAFSLANSKIVVAAIVAAGVATSLSSVTLAGAGSRRALADLTFLWWIPFLAAIGVLVARTRETQPIRWRMEPVALAAALVVVANGLTSYTEIKTTYGWNMYSNLVVVAGESNHLLMPDGLALRDGHDRLIEIVESDDPAIRAYAAEKYLMPWPSFRLLVRERPDARVVYLENGKRIEVSRVGDAAELMAPTRWWWSWFPLRSVHREVPQRCQSSALAGL